MLFSHRQFPPEIKCESRIMKPAGNCLPNKKYSLLAIKKKYLVAALIHEYFIKIIIIISLVQCSHAFLIAATSIYRLYLSSHIVINSSYLYGFFIRFHLLDFYMIRNILFGHLWHGNCGFISKPHNNPAVLNGKTKGCWNVMNGRLLIQLK